MFNYFKKNTKINFKMHKFNSEYHEFESLNKNNRFTLTKENIYPCLDDNTEFTGFDAHYIYHPGWAARIVKEINPKFHTDVSSTLHFCSILSAFFEVKFYDYRPASLNLSNLSSNRIDLTNMYFESNSIESLSCMHTVEHIGLGRYGDPIDPEGDLKAIAELKRVVKQGGSLLFVVPLGNPKIMFNAHRIYSFNMIMQTMDGFVLKEFSMVYDDQTFVRNANPEDVSTQNYACGCFWFVKTVTQ